MIARVVVENAAYSFDIPFSYQVPQQMQPDIRPGCRVLVPFGKANRAKQGLVLALEEGGEQENLKPLKTLLDYQPLLDSEQLWLLELLHRRTFCTYYEALRALVPSGLTVKVRVMCSLGEKANLQELQQPLQELQQKVLDYLREKISRAHRKVADGPWHRAERPGLSGADPAGAGGPLGGRTGKER